MAVGKTLVLFCSPFLNSWDLWIFIPHVRSWYWIRFQFHMPFFVKQTTLYKRTRRYLRTFIDTDPKKKSMLGIDHKFLDISSGMLHLQIYISLGYTSSIIRQSSTFLLMADTWREAWSSRHPHLVAGSELVVFWWPGGVCKSESATRFWMIPKQ